MTRLSNSQSIQRARYRILGAVQGVGYRPFVYRLAKDLGLNGWVSNSGQGLLIEVEGSPDQVQIFNHRIQTTYPPNTHIHSFEYSFHDGIGYTSFNIRESDSEGEKNTLILPDISTCPSCLNELFNPQDRRFLYSFLNCTHCGPRYSIILSLPYDRNNTTMADFQMCEQCAQEYSDPIDRRFHAQPTACAVCGPDLEFRTFAGIVLGKGIDALNHTIEALNSGGIVAIKGIGGFQLLVDAANDGAVKQLRNRKHREEKPFAVMFPSIETVHQECHLSPLEESLLVSVESPIVILRRKTGGDGFHISESVSPDNPNLGVMLPYSPLHHLLMKGFAKPVVATSGNRSDEPICIDESDLQDRLGDIADHILFHNRKIQRHVDDSIVREMAGFPMILRRARGYAPLPIDVLVDCPPLLAVGGQMKNTVAFSRNRQVFLSQHIGDLETEESIQAFQMIIEDLTKLLDMTPVGVVCDLHPDYYSTHYAESLGLEVHRVQHHLAHVYSCLAENRFMEPALGVAWDGTGYGTDGTIWGGEFFLVNQSGSRHIGSLCPFPLPGSDQAARQPRRSLLGLLHSLYGTEGLNDVTEVLQYFTPREHQVLISSLEHSVSTTMTSSVGRLFDAVASLLNLRQKDQFEGQAAMLLQHLAETSSDETCYPLELVEDITSGQSIMRLSHQKYIESIKQDRRNGVAPADIARRFHNTLVEWLVQMAEYTGVDTVALSGGCFQNRLLLESAVAKLTHKGFRVLRHQRVPPNDGGLSLGQIHATALSLRT